MHRTSLARNATLRFEFLRSCIYSVAVIVFVVIDHLCGTTATHFVRAHVWVSEVL